MAQGEAQDATTPADSVKSVGETSTSQQPQQAPTTTTAAAAKKDTNGQQNTGASTSTEPSRGARMRQAMSQRIEAIPVDKAYLLTKFGILKVLQLIIGFIGFLCVVTSLYSGTLGLYVIVAVICLVFTGVLLFCYLLGATERVKFFNWNFMEVIYCCSATLMYLIACIIVATYAQWSGALTAGTIFGFVNVALYGIDAFWRYNHWKDEDLLGERKRPPGNNDVSTISGRQPDHVDPKEWELLTPNNSGPISP